MKMTVLWAKNKQHCLTSGVQKSHVSFMPRTLPPLNALRAFEAAARLHSFTKAAEELNVSHSAISRHVRGLEKRLDISLFTVAQRGVNLTPEGCAYVEQISPALDQIAAATEQLMKRPAGTISLSAEPSFAQKWLVPRLGKFQALHPDVEVVLHASSDVVDVEAHAVDMALRFCWNDKDTDGYDLVSDRPFYPYAAPSLVGTDPISVEEMAQHWLVGYYIPELWSMWFEEAGFSGARELKRTAAMQSLLGTEYAVSGQGLLLMSSDLVEPEVRDGKLVQLSDVGIHCGAYYLVTNKIAARRRAVRVFRDWLLEESAVLRD
jgi:DNA-binding transcriptional LysR family regulator